MSRELILEVVARKNSKDLNALADDFEKLARKSETAGKSLGKTATFSQHLDGEISKTKQTIRELGQEFDKTGSKDVFAKLRGAQSNLRSLEGIKRDLTKAFSIAGDDSAKSFWQRFGSSKAVNNGLTTALANSLGGLSGVWSVAGPLLVSGAPVVGAEVGAALLLGVGLAGIGAGIAGQLKDPAIQAAGADVGKKLSTEFQTATSGFRVPMLVAIHDIGNEVDKLGPGLKSTFDKLAPLTVTLERGVVGFVDKLVPGLEHAAVASKPLVELFSARLPELGRAIGGVFDAAAQNSTEAAQALNLLLNVTEATVSGLQPTIFLLSKAFDIAKFTGVLGFLSDVGTKSGDSGTQIQDAFTKASDALKNFSTAEGQAGTAAGVLSNSIATLFGQTMSVDQATGTWTHDLANLKGQLDAHSRSLNEATDAGHQNAEALRRMAQEAEAVREATIAQAGGQNASAAAVAAANAKYSSQIGELEALAVKLHLSRDQVQALLDKYRELAKAPNIAKSINIHTNYSTSFGGTGPYANKQIPTALGGVMIPAAQGMIYSASNPPLIKFAEPSTGGEALIPRRGIAAARGLALADTAASWYGGRVMSGRGGGTTLTLSAGQGGTSLERALLPLVTTLLRNGAIALYDGSGKPVQVRG